MITVAKGDRQVYRFGADPGADSKRLIFAKQVGKLEEPRNLHHFRFAHQRR